MPCYLFTYHAYRSWMPDHKRGYVRRKEGVLPSNQALSKIYRQQASAEPVGFDERNQRLLIDELLNACGKQNYDAQCAATDITHLHALVCWRTDRTWMQVRTNLKSSLTRRLNRENGRRLWFSEGASRKRVKDRAHFNYLVGTYLPKHSGWKWRANRGFFKLIAGGQRPPENNRARLRSWAVLRRALASGYW